MGTKVNFSPVEIINIADDDEDDDDDVVSLLCPSSISSRHNAISVEQYSENKDLQLAIIASLSPPKRRRIIDLSGNIDDHDDDDEIQIINSFTNVKNKGITINEPGQSSNSKHTTFFMCEICVEEKSRLESFRVSGCQHVYCSDCVSKYVAAKLQDNIVQIGCPVLNCNGLLEPDYCRQILPKEVFDRWGNALCEAVVLALHRFYCPFKDCSALLVDERRDGEVIKQSECPDCKRLFCAECKVPWHSGIECGEFQKLNKDEREKEDIMLMKLAKQKNWIRCPKCRFYVEKSQGCLFMKCRCGHTFCYNCGAPLKAHFCVNCKR